MITGAGLLAAAAVGACWLSIDLPSELNYARFKRGCGWGVAGTLPPLLLFIALRNLPSAAVRRVDKIIRQQLLPLFDGLPWYGLLWVAMLAGVSEEVFFRGVLQQAVSAFAPAWLSDSGGGHRLWTGTLRHRDLRLSGCHDGMLLRLAVCQLRQPLGTDRRTWPVRLYRASVPDVGTSQSRLSRRAT